jgi:hypothetical protein
MINLKYQHLKENFMELFQVIREQRFGDLSSTEKNLLAMMKDLKALKPIEPTNPFDWAAWDSRMEVYNELMENIQTIRSKTIKPRGVMFAETFGGEVVVGFALCNFNYFDWNKTNKDVLKEIAKGRAYTWKNKTLDEVMKSVPESIYGELYSFCNRVDKYFKNVKLADWIAEFLDYDQQEVKLTDNVSCKIVDSGWQDYTPQSFANAIGLIVNSLLDEAQGTPYTQQGANKLSGMANSLFSEEAEGQGC